tara:strand:+ start:351 stop:569 length:219 start_codon:yes stop_codon:yes gene_type:complete
VQAAVNYANRQLQQKIKTQMLAKMDKLTEGKTKKKAKDDGELMLGDDSSDEMDDDEKLQMVVDGIWLKYDIN